MEYCNFNRNIENSIRASWIPSIHNMDSDIQTDRNMDATTICTSTRIWCACNQRWKQESKIGYVIPAVLSYIYSTMIILHLKMSNNLHISMVDIFRLKGAVRIVSCICENLNKHISSTIQTYTHTHALASFYFCWNVHTHSKNW